MNRPVLTRNVQTSSFCEGNWGPKQKLIGELYGCLPIITIPFIVGLVTKNWVAVWFSCSIISLLSLGSVVWLCKLFCQIAILPFRHNHSTKKGCGNNV